MAFRRLVVPLLIVALLGAACGDDEGDSAGVAVDQPIGAPDPGSGFDGGPVETPAVAKSGAIAMEVPRRELEGAAQAVIDIATAPEVGGFLVSSVLDLQDGHGSGSIVVKVPAAAFEPAIVQLGEVGDVTRQEMAGQDLTPDALEAVREVGRARARVAALAALLEDAEDETERGDVQRRLGAARAALERATEAREFVRAETTYSPIEVALAGKPPPAPAQTSLERAVDTSRSIALGILSAFVVAAAVVLPVGGAALALYALWSAVLRRLRVRWES
jgi:hypothetical protein